MYSDDKDKTDGGWIYFFDGHSEYWSNERLKAEIQFRGLQLLKTQIKLVPERIQELLLEDCKGFDCMKCAFWRLEGCRLKSVFRKITHKEDSTKE